jgi:outer membrane protein OmpA-like peptidoglycan-associated protein
VKHLVAVVLAVVSLAAPAFADTPERPMPVDEAALKVTVDRSTVDLVKHRLEVKMSRTAKSVRIKVMDAEGATLTEETHDFDGKAAGTALVVTWKPARPDPVGRIEVYGYDQEDHWAGVALIPWSVEIPHQEVLFATNSSKIEASEKPKLEESYDRIKKGLADHKELGNISLFIGGHTDTVGTAAHNAELSRKRARSIASWFKKRGLKIAVYYEGFGESSLAVKTKDEVDEARNRRADYILSIEAPQLKSGAKAGWKKL